MKKTKTSAREAVCRQDACPRLELHPPHAIDPTLVRAAAKADRVRDNRRYPRRPWKLQTSDGLRAAIYAAISAYEPRTFVQIYRLVVDDYGSCCERAVHRHLRWLREHGRIIRFDVRERNICAYLRAGAKIDPDYICEHVLETAPMFGVGLR